MRNTWTHLMVSDTFYFIVDDTVFCPKDDKPYCPLTIEIIQTQSSFFKIFPVFMRLFNLYVIVTPFFSPKK